MKNRLSKLQKWILKRGYEDCGVLDRHFLEFYGLYDPQTHCKKAFGNANRVTKLRCKRRMFLNGLLEMREGKTILTQKGINTLKANDCQNGQENISFNDYSQRVDEWLKGAKAWRESLRAMLRK